MSQSDWNRRDCMSPVYHPVRTKAEYLRESAGWYQQRRRSEILWRLGSLVVLAVFAFLVLD